MREYFKGTWAQLYAGLGALYALGAMVVVLTAPAEKQWDLVVNLCVTPLIFVLSFFLASLVCLAVHELGHLLAGRLAGFPWLAITIGPVSLVKTSQGVKTRWSGYKSLSGLAQCHIKGHDRLRVRLALFVLGGPVASVFLLVLGVALFRQVGGLDFVFDRSEQSVASIASRAMVLMFLGAALSTAFGSLLPIGIRGVDTDMRILWRLLIGGSKGERQVALAMLGAKISAGIRYRDWEPELLETALKPHDLTPARLQALFLAYLHELDSGNYAAARRHIEEAVAIEPRIHEIYLKLKRAVKTENAFAIAMMGEHETAQLIHDRLGPGDKESLVHRKRVLAAIKYSSGQFEEGESLQAEYARELLGQPRVFSRALLQAEIEWLEAVRTRFHAVPQFEFASFVAK